MIKIFRTIDGGIHQVNEAQEGCWVALVNPTATELLEISEQYEIEVDDLRAPLDEEERSRIEAVSYTHLDVYKRQSALRTREAFLWNCVRSRKIRLHT